MSDAHETLSPLAVRRALGPKVWGPPVEIMPGQWRFPGKGERMTLIVSEAPHFMAHIGRGDEWWIHASMTREGRTPDYDDLVTIHRAVFGEGFAYQVFTPTDQHVNIAEYALHLWGRSDGKPVTPLAGRLPWGGLTV